VAKPLAEAEHFTFALQHSITTLCSRAVQAVPVEQIRHDMSRGVRLGHAGICAARMIRTKVFSPAAEPPWRRLTLFGTFTESQ
jgi:hypothetical protein